MGARLVKQSFPTRSSSSFRLFMAAQKNQGFSLPPFFQPPQQNSGGPSLPSFFQPPQQSSGGPSFPSFFQPPEQSSGGFSLPSFFQAPKQTPEISPTVASSNARELSARWRELAGSNDWAGLLDPMDPVLRSELIRYGEFAQACYDAFDFDRYSKYCGGCKYPRESFFESLRMADVGYRVTRYLYATSNIQLPNFSLQPIMKDPTLDPTNWIGYVAVSDDATSARLGRRDIIVAWRGTISKLEWISDITDIQQPLADEGIPCPDKSVKALLGFLNLYTDKDPSVPVAKYSVREQALAEVKRLVGLYGEKQGEELSISVAGHSLGSALATLNAFDIAEVGLHKVGKDKVIPITVYSFSGPRVGNDAFKKRFEETLKIKCIRVLNIADVVPAVPGVAVNEQTPEAWQRSAGAVVPWSYYHVGVKLELDHTKSPFLKNTIDVAGFHNLEALMHLVDGYQGKGQKFSSASGRDPAPVNKKSDFLKEELMVPPYWKQESDRGLVRIAAGKWAQPDRARFDEHPEDMDRVLQQIGVLASSRA